MSRSSTHMSPISKRSMPSSPTVAIQPGGKTSVSKSDRNLFRQTSAIRESGPAASCFPSGTGPQVAYRVNHPPPIASSFHCGAR